MAERVRGILQGTCPVHRQRECGTVCEVQGRTVGARNGNRERLIQSCYGDKKELESKTDGHSARDA